MERCRNCRSANIIEDDRTADVVCRGCGEVQGRVLYNGPDWFDEEQSRIGPAVDDFSTRVFGEESSEKLRDTHRLIYEMCGNDLEIRRVAIVLLERSECSIQNMDNAVLVGALLCLAHKECDRKYSIGEIAGRLNTDMIRVGRAMRRLEKRWLDGFRSHWSS